MARIFKLGSLSIFLLLLVVLLCGYLLNFTWESFQEGFSENFAGTSETFGEVVDGYTTKLIPILTKDALKVYFDPLNKFIIEPISLKRLVITNSNNVEVVYDYGKSGNYVVGGNNTIGTKPFVYLPRNSKDPAQKSVEYAVLYIPVVLNNTPTNTTYFHTMSLAQSLQLETFCISDNDIEFIKSETPIENMAGLSGSVSDSSGVKTAATAAFNATDVLSSSTTNALTVFIKTRPDINMLFIGATNGATSFRALVKFGSDSIPVFGVVETTQPQTTATSNVSETTNTQTTSTETRTNSDFANTISLMKEMKAIFGSSVNNDYMLKTEVVPHVCPQCPSCTSNKSGVCTDCGGNGGAGTKSTHSNSNAKSNSNSNSNPSGIALMRDFGTGVDQLLRDGVSGATDLARETVTGTYGAMKNTVSGSKDIAGNVYGAATNAVGNTVGIGREVVGGTVGLGRDVVGGTVGLGRDVVGGTVGLGKDVVGGTFGYENSYAGGQESQQQQQQQQLRGGYLSPSQPAMTGGQDPYGYFGNLSSKNSSNYMPVTADFSSFGK